LKIDRNLSKNFIWNAIGTTFTSFSSFIILIIVTRINGLNDAGVFSLAFATASILYVFALYSGRNCQITDIKGTITDKEYVLYRGISSLIAIAIMIIYIIIANYNANEIYILISISLWKISEGFADVLYAVFQKNDILYKSGISLTLKTIIGIGSFILIDIITNNMNLAFSCLYLANFLIIIIYDFIQIKGFIHKDEKIRIYKLAEIFKGEFWIFANTFLLIFILNEPKYVIDYYFTNEIQAIFGIIIIPASIIPLFSQFVISPIVNGITKSYKDGKVEDVKKLDLKINLWILGFGIISTIIGYLIGIPVLEFIFNQDLGEQKIAFIIILIAYIFYGLAQSKIILLTMLRKLKEQFMVHITSAILIIIVSNILIGNYELMGTAYTYFIIMVFYYFSLTIITKYYIKKS